MTDRALGRMTMRRNTPRIKRRLQRTDRVAITYTAEEFHHLFVVAGTGEHCREVFEEILAIQTPASWSRRDLYAKYRPAGAIRCSLSVDSCRGVEADTLVVIDALSDEREQSLMPCLRSASSPQIWRPDVEFTARADGRP